MVPLVMPPRLVETSGQTVQRNLDQMALDVPTPTPMPTQTTNASTNQPAGGVQLVTVDGRSARAIHYRYSPASATRSWLIPHNLHFRPMVEVHDTEGRVVQAEVAHLSDDVLSVDFAFPFAGTAYLL